MELTEIIAQFITDTKDDDIPQQVYDHAKVCFLDWLGVTIAGKDESLVHKLIAYTDIMGGHEQAFIIGHNIKKSVEQAALINGAASHALDYDDTLFAFLGHPSVTLFSSILALSEWKEKSGSDFLTAYIIGLKAASCIGLCSGMEHYKEGWHGTSTIGHFASAAACARLLKLSKKQAQYALGIAGTQSSGLKAVFGTMCKPFHAGKSSMAGLMAALLADNDFTSAEDIFEGKHGFFQLFKGKKNDDVVATLGKSWEIENIAQKYHASCHATHSPIEAVLNTIIKEKINTDTIQSITIHCSEIALDAAGKMEPATGLEGKFSISYCVANAILRDNTGLQAFTDKKVNAPEIKELIKKITIIPKKDMAETAARIEIKTETGKTYSGHGDIMKEVPPYEVKKKKIAAKFMDLVAPLIGEKNTADLISMILSLDTEKSLSGMIDLINTK